MTQLTEALSTSYYMGFVKKKSGSFFCLIGLPFLCFGCHHGAASFVVFLSSLSKEVVTG